jgi:small subunit ribosomal protein S20
MANHKSAKKRIKTNEKRRVRNRATVSKLKTLVKKVEAATEKAEAEVLYKEAVSFIDRIATRGKIHKNTAARKKSALTLLVNGLTAETK